MTLYKINCPSKKVLIVGADSIYHAIQLAFQRENYQFDREQYLRLNYDQVKAHEDKIKKYKKCKF